MLNRRSFLSTLGMAAIVPRIGWPQSASLGPLHQREAARTIARIIPMRVALDSNGMIGCAIADPAIEQLMLGLDAELAKTLLPAQELAAQNGASANWLPVGARVHLPNYVDTMPPHAALHLCTALGDQIEWISPDGLDFQIDIHRDPRMVLVDEPGPANAIVLGKNTGKDNPFNGIFPLRSGRGEAVRSGIVLPAANAQAHFMYDLSSSRSDNVFDPDVICGTPMP